MILLDAATQGAGGFGTLFIIIAVYFVIFYFIIIKPQKKEKQAHQNILESLENGDYVLTSSGMYGTIIDITDDMVIVEFGNNKNCRIPMQKTAIVEVEKAK